MRSAVTRLPQTPGVYRFCGTGGRVLYLRRAVDLRRRVASYWGVLRGRRHLRALVARIEAVEAVECDSPHEAAWLERNLLRERRPRWNRSRSEEVPVYLRLDGRTRSPGLVDSELARRREDAAHALAYERAGQIQAESEALDWLVAEQKVATVEPVRCDITGGADGALVRFAVRDGLLSSWTQQRCSEAMAQPQLASTPPKWTAFAERSARLAATLAGPEVKGAARSRTPTRPTAVGAGRARPARR